MGSGGKPPNPPATVNMESIICVCLQAPDEELMQIWLKDGLKPKKKIIWHHVNGVTTVISKVLVGTWKEFLLSKLLLDQM